VSVPLQVIEPTLEDYSGHCHALVASLVRATAGSPVELWSGEGRPVPYPAACRPQAWAAASAVVVAQAVGAL